MLKNFTASQYGRPSLSWHDEENIDKQNQTDTVHEAVAAEWLQRYQLYQLINHADKGDPEELAPVLSGSLKDEVGNVAAIEKDLTMALTYQ